MKYWNLRRKTVCLAAVLAVFLIFIYITGMIIPMEWVDGSFLQAKQKPSLSHLFGTDPLGRDLFFRTWKGMSVSMTVGFVASFISIGIAMIVGMLAAIGSKRVDAIVNWLIDLVMGVPHTILIILISFALGRGLFGLLAGLAATHWCSLARLIRAEVLQLRSAQYVAISRKLGKTSIWIMVHHLLPHIFPQLLVGAILMFPHAILHEASISFLGFGLPPEEPAIGIILSESMRYLSTGMWWMAVLPGVSLIMIVLLIDKLGEWVRKLVDPYTANVSKD